MNKLGFGFMRLPLLDNRDETSVDMIQTAEMVDRYLESGCNYFDTAHRYHGFMSEKAIHDCLTTRYDREDYILANKMTLTPFIKKEADQEPFFQNQLAVCGVTYFDVYLIHCINKTNYEKAVRFHTFEYLISLKKRGLVKRIGFSFHGSPDLLEKILSDYPEFDIVQLQINYLDWLDPGIQSKKCYEIAASHEMTVMTMESIKGGNLISIPEEASAVLHEVHPDWSPAFWALSFCASLERVEVVLSGMSTVRQVTENITEMSHFSPLDQSELDALLKAAEIIRSKTAIACTGCQYCESYCPRKIAIPGYFSLYNLENNTGINYIKTASMYYASLSEGRGKASECLSCGICETHCPQNLPIRKYLKDVAQLFESTQLVTNHNFRPAQN